MIRLLALLATVSVGVICATSAVAQTRIPDRAAKVPSSVARTGARAADAQRVLNSYAKCVVNKSRRGVESYLSILPGTANAGPALLKLMTDECLDSGDLRFKPPLIRGALFESLYQADLKWLKTSNLKAAPAIDYSSGAPSAMSDGTKFHLGLLDFADCIVRSAPDEVLGLLGTKVASAAEAASFGGLGPTMNACLTKDVSLTFSRPILRGVLAESLYRLSAANAGHPMSAKSN